MQTIFLTKEESEARSQNRRKVLLLIIAGILINYLGELFASLLPFSLYFDSTGTILVAVLSGAFPGIVVGLCSNIIKVFNDPTSMYYSSLNVLIAVCTAGFVKKGWLKKPYGVIPLVLNLGVIGGGFGGILTWSLYGTESEQVSAGLAEYFFVRCRLSQFWSEICASLVIDWADKAISVLVAFLILYFIPRNKWYQFRLEGWKQRPLTNQARKAVNSSECRRTSLRIKLILMLVTATVTVGVIITWISFNLYRDSTIKTNTQLGESIAQLAAGLLDPDKVNDYIEKGDADPDYELVEKELHHLKDSSDNIEYIYVYQIREDGCHVVFDLDTEDAEASEPGEVIAFDESFSPFIDTLLAGGRIQPIITNDTYGWLLTVYEPVIDSSGKCVCYAAADISMLDLETEFRSYIVKMVSLFVGFLVLVIASGLWFADYHVTLPVNTMARVANDFAFNSEEERGDSVLRIRDLDIRTGDEIENLYHAVLKLASDSMRQVDKITEKNRMIEKLQNSLILVLADMVESRDENTGHHVRKTAKYVEIIIDQLQKEGIFEDPIDEVFRQKVINSAPLHDIGKITIPDAILNKPGRLDDAEFEIMRSHAAAGRDIISNIIDMVPDSDFLKEARDLAAHHHERWDGKGYPDRLSGEEIPLSARIMAVADVFDALVSKRSYKDGFPFEKAMSIIREGIGTQFDPQVAEAFMRSADRVREVAESFKES